MNKILNNLDTIARSLKEAMQKGRLSDAEKRNWKPRLFCYRGRSGGGFRG